MLRSQTQQFHQPTGVSPPGQWNLIPSTLQRLLLLEGPSVPLLVPIAPSCKQIHRLPLPHSERLQEFLLHLIPTG